MLELSQERIDQMLHEETMKSEELSTILRTIYTRYMRLYEDYLSDLEALNDDKIAEFRKYNEETKSLVKYYYMDIPHDVCLGLHRFESEYGEKLLGPDWYETISKSYEDFKKENWSISKTEEDYKAEFTQKANDSFYDAMDYVFRDGFGTGSETVQSVVDGITGFLFGKKSK